MSKYKGINKIYLHWTATDYNWAEPGHYHTVILGDGTVKRLTSYSEDLFEHTYGRNKNSIGLAVACMGGRPDPWTIPPTPKQLDALCKEAAMLALDLGWPADATALKRLIMTHAEAAANRDYDIDLVRKFSNKSPSSSWDHAAQAAGLPHANYGPSSWHDGWPGGDVFRWDLWKLTKHGRGGSGGFLLREKIVEWMKKLKK